MKKALQWWNNTLTEEGRGNFPRPINNDDILEYYLNPAENTLLKYESINF